MKFSTSDWHTRFSRQADWTAELRNYLYQKIQINPNQYILDLGCGTGALISELKNLVGNNIFGVDLSFDNIQFAKENYSPLSLAQGDGIQLPFAKNTFDITLCHYLLLWVVSPLNCLHEIYRVTKTKGWVLALAEPDYGGRVDFPTDLSIIGQWQSQALLAQNADPRIGRKLLNLFIQTGLKNVQCGVLGGQWDTNFNQEAWQSEWDVIENDLGFLRISPDPQEIKLLRELDLESGRAGNRLLYVPTFYANGQVP